MDASHDDLEALQLEAKLIYLMYNSLLTSISRLSRSCAKCFVLKYGVTANCYTNKYSFNLIFTELPELLH